MKDKLARFIAFHLPHRVHYWTVVRMGVRYIGGAKRPNEEVPAVPYLTVLERIHEEIFRKKRPTSKRSPFKRSRNDV